MNLQSKQIWLATMKDDVDKVEQLRQDVTKMAWIRARLAPPARRGTPIPQLVQLGRYHASDTGGFAARQGRDNPNSPAATSDNKLVEWNEASEVITPKATQTRVTLHDGGEKINSGNLDPPTIGNAATAPTR